jgi:hypothetical protein
VRQEGVSAFQTKYLACRFLGYGYDAGKKAWRFVIEGTTKAIYSRNFRVDERPLQGKEGRTKTATSEEQMTAGMGNLLQPSTQNTPAHTTQGSTRSHAPSIDIQDRSGSALYSSQTAQTQPETNVQRSPSPKTPNVATDVATEREAATPLAVSRGQRICHPSFIGSALATLARLMR